MRPDDALILDRIFPCRRRLRSCDGVDWKSFQDGGILQGIPTLLAPLEAFQPPPEPASTS